MKKKYILYLFSLLLLMQAPLMANDVKITTEFELLNQEQIVEDNHEENTLFEISTHTTFYLPTYAHIENTLSTFLQYINFSIFRPPIFS